MRAVSARFESVFRDVIDKVVDVQAVARGINAFDARHIILIADGAFRTAVNIDVQAFGKFVSGISPTDRISASHSIISSVPLIGCIFRRLSQPRRR